MRSSRSFRRIRKSKAGRPTVKGNKREMVYLDNTSTRSSFTFGKREQSIRARKFKFVLKKKKQISERKESLSSVNSDGEASSPLLSTASLFSFGGPVNKPHFNDQLPNNHFTQINLEEAFKSKGHKNLVLNLRLTLSLNADEPGSERTLDTLNETFCTKSLPISPSKHNKDLKRPVKPKFDFFKLFYV